MPASKTYTQNINRSKLQLKTIFKPQKKEPKAKEPNAQKVIPKLPKNDVFTRVEPKVVEKKIQPNTSQKIDVHEKITLIWKIQKYQNSQRFGQFVRNAIHVNHTESQLKKLSITQLNDILAKIRIQLDNRNLDDFYNSLIKGGATVMETVLNPYYNIDGYGDNLINNKTFMDALERYKIEHPFPSISPSIQLSYAMISTFVMTHEINKRGLNPNIAKKTSLETDVPLEKPVVSMEAPNIEELSPEMQKEFQDEFLSMLKKTLDEDLDSNESLSTIEEGSQELSEVASEDAESEEQKLEEAPVASVGAKI